MERLKRHTPTSAGVNLKDIFWGFEDYYLPQQIMGLYEKSPTVFKENRIVSKLNVIKTIIAEFLDMVISDIVENDIEVRRSYTDNSRLHVFRFRPWRHDNSLYVKGQDLYATHGHIYLFCLHTRKISSKKHITIPISINREYTEKIAEKVNNGYSYATKGTRTVDYYLNLLYYKMPEIAQESIKKIIYDFWKKMCHLGKRRQWFDFRCKDIYFSNIPWYFQVFGRKGAIRLYAKNLAKRINFVCKERHVPRGEYVYFYMKRGTSKWFYEINHVKNKYRLNPGKTYIFRHVTFCSNLDACWAGSFPTRDLFRIKADFLQDQRETAELISLKGAEWIYHARNPRRLRFLYPSIHEYKTFQYKPNIDQAWHYKKR